MVNKKFALVSLLLLGVIFFSQVYSVESFDLWWHLKSAEVILKSGLPTTDIFSATTPQIHWFPFEWLGEIFFYLFYLFGGINLLILVKASLAATTWFLILQALDKQKIALPLSFLLAAAGFYLTLSSWPLRPLIFSFFFFALFSVLLFNYRPFHYLLPLIILAWANIHPSFYLGFLLLTLFYFGEWLNRSHSESKVPGKALITRYGWLLAGCFLASFIHPRPQEILVYPLKLLSSEKFMGGISEWQPAPFASEPFFYLAVLPVLLVALGRVKKIGWQRVLPLLVFGGYAFTAVRHIPLFAIIAALNLPLAFGDFFEGEGRRPFSHLAYCGGVLILAAALFNVRAKAGTLGVKSGLFPEQAVRFIEKIKLEGPMYNAYDWGGYLIWRLYPGTKTFIDGRNSSEKMFLLDRRLREAYDGYQNILDNYRINYILTNSTYFDSGRIFPLVEALFNDARWSLIYQDETALLFLKNIPANEKFIRENKIDKSRIYRQVIAEAKDRLTYDPNLPVAYFSLGKAYLQLNDLPRARKNLAKALEMRPDFRPAQELLELVNRWRRPVSQPVVPD